ncbi:hypothetical protein [uncultured Kordia sp.]|uniref:hypothetical protein n=1 Tax=uncultured Kordia sp. TaxID=507699 RepID=UPI0026082E5D|nr:hypothetical protein [uncultured Kordia sp.]
MKTTKILFLLVCMIFLACTNDTTDNLKNNTRDEQNSNLSQRLNPYEISQLIIYWLPLEGTKHYENGIYTGSTCFNLGYCDFTPINSDIEDFQLTDEHGGTPVYFSLIDENHLQVQILREPTPFEEIQDGINMLSGSDITAEELYELFKTRINIEGELYIGQEISQLLLPDTDVQEITILPGAYPIDYSNSEYGEFVVEITQN